MYILALGLIFVMPSGDGVTMYYLTLESIFVTSSGARKDNALSYFVVNLCNA